MGSMQNDHVFSIGAIFVAVLVGYVAFGYPTESSYFPRVLAVFLGFMALMLLVRTRFFSAASSRKNESQAKSRLSEEQVDQLKSAALVFGGVLAYVGAIKLVNYEISTVVFLVAFILALGYRNFVWIAVTAVGLTLLLYAVFFNFLAVARPDSLFFF